MTHPCLSCAIYLSLISVIVNTRLADSFLVLTEPCCGFISSTHGTCRQGHPKPIDPEGWPLKFPAKNHCSKCGLCETTFVSSVKEACALLPDTGMSRMHYWEEIVHGRRRDCETLLAYHDDADESRFGVLHEPMKLAKGVGMPGSQWTGVVTSIAVAMLETGQVDAVVCVAADDNDWSRPVPILARTVNEVLAGRGVKPSLSPSLRVLDDISNDSSIRRLLFCGVGCAVQAFRAVQSRLNLDAVYVLGTNCVDNSPTPRAAQEFLRAGLLINEPQTVRGYEFMQDFRVHAKVGDQYVTKPYFCLPGTIAQSSIATSCLACFDYTNALADVVIGYMGAPLTQNQRMDEAYQTMSVRNTKGALMIDTAIKAGRLHVSDIARGSGKYQSLVTSTVLSDSIVQGMVGGKVLDKGLPTWLGDIMSYIVQNVGPKGLSFARYSIDYHVIRNYFHVLDFWGEETVNNFLPTYARLLVEEYLDKEQELAKIRDKIKAK